MEPYLGEIRLFGFSFAPTGWQFCEGQLLSISSNTALFSLLGTMYGGDGRVTFGLPDLRGRVAVAAGQGPGLPAYQQGEVGGNASVTLTASNVQGHGHGVVGSATASSKSPQGLSPAFTAAGSSYGSPDGTPMSAGMVVPNGSNTPFSVMPPYLGLRYAIAVEGIYPPRS